jgi:oxygen-independent coproporphyrinogen-3 oxidase
MKAFGVARSIFDRVSFDLIYARQYQTRADWTAELRMALDLAVDHLSLYQLTIEDGTAFGKRFDEGKLAGLPTDDFGADLFERTQEICDEAGMPAYEVSNHAKPDAQSRHNLIYWRYGDYAGIGPGAHGRLTLDGQRYATDTVKSPEGWLSLWEKTGSGENTRDIVTEEDRHLECLMMGLRLSEGVDLRRLPNYAGSDIFNNKIKYLGDLGLVSLEKDQLIATRHGRMVLNTVLKELISD